MPAAGRGFSVYYHNRYLYSRYNPQAAPIKTAISFDILPNTLVLVFSPLLGYGLKELIDKLPDDSVILLIEADEELFKLSNEYLQQIIKNKKNIYNVCIADGKSFFSLFNQNLLPAFSNFKRCLPIELSGGAQLYKLFYHSLTALADNAINQFWRNRITLVKLGRLYARNIFKNLGRVPFADYLKIKSVIKPIVVCGSGPSVENIIPFLQKNSDDCFVISVDNALMTLIKSGIFPDAVIAVESQLAIEKAYIGSCGTRIPIIADLTSRPHVMELTGGKVSFFLSEYEQCNYLDRIKKILNIVTMVPLGSVGLAAMEIALTLRKDESIPVFFCGLDFSFKPCKTHCRETPSHRKLLDEHNRLSTILCGESSFDANSFYFTGKDGKASITTPALSGYGKTFSARYSNVQNTFDIATEGMDTNIKKKSLENVLEIVQHFRRNIDTTARIKIHENDNQISCLEKVKKFLIDELKSLEELRTILITGKKTEKIIPIIKEREYLYLHFPDGYKEPTLDISFLNRIRAEIDFFIKDIKFSLNFLEENTKT